MSLLTKVRSYESFFDTKLSKKKEQTRKLYKYSLDDFDSFCKKNLTNSLEASIENFKKANTDEIIDVLQLWINNSPIGRQSNLKGRLSQINNYLYYRGIKIDSRDLKDLEYENSEPEERRPIRFDELKKIVNAATNRQRALILSLSSSGMAIGEACNLLKSDFDFSQSRIMIHIKPSYTKKSGRGRTVFISREAEAFVKPILDKLEDNQRVFGYSPTVEDSINNYQNQFRRLVDKIGLGLKYESGKRQKTLHALRAYFFTKANKVHGLDYAHKLCGHKGYLSQYNRLEESEKLEMYLKLEPELFINEVKPVSEEIIQLREQVAKYKQSYDEFTKLSTDKKFQEKELGPLIEKITKRMKEELRAEIKEEMKKK